MLFKSIDMIVDAVSAARSVFEVAGGDGGDVGCAPQTGKCSVVDVGYVLAHNAFNVESVFGVVCWHRRRFTRQTRDGPR